MSEAAGLALLEAGWSEVLLKRRLEVFRLRVNGHSMDDIAEQVGVSRRAAYYDWQAIREVLAMAAGPELEVTRSKAEARLETIYSRLMAEAGRALQSGRASVSALREARATVVSLCELRGAIDRRPVIAPIIDTEGLSDKSEEELRELLGQELSELRDMAVRNGGNGGES